MFCVSSIFYVLGNIKMQLKKRGFANVDCIWDLTKDSQSLFTIESIEPNDQLEELWES